MAVLGGIVLTGLVLLTVVSIAGRTMNTLLHWSWLQGTGLSQRLIGMGVGPVTGDFELVESGVAFTIFAFLPITQISGAHAVVDVFTAMLPRGVNRFLLAFWEALFAVALIVIAWRLYEGMLGKMKYNETTFLLQYPVWWSYAASLAAACVAAAVGGWCAIARCFELITGRTVLAGDGEAVH